MRDATTILAGIGAAGCWYFVGVFWWLSRGDWRHNRSGRHLMQFTANLGLLLTLIVVARIWPDYTGRPVVTLVAFAALVAQIWHRVFLMHWAQRTRVPDRTPAGRS